MYRVVYWFFSNLFRLLWRFRYYGRENLPDAPYMVVGNHYGLFDPVFITGALPRKDKPRYMAKAELFRFPPMRWFMTSVGGYPVERGKSDISAVRKTIEVLKAGHNVLIFPEGTRVKKEDPANALTGCAMIACKADVPLVPVYITHRRRMLIDSIRVYIGSPFRVALLEGVSRTESYKAATFDMMARIYSMNPDKQ
ncbi:MAG: 1-acyl-sn-glycerol-3-phosphate acyltransferase [Oscillospiraceae bacterium]|jgi:1-acyl-sn-glycerol-3-phosphate acyltransferase|nr:1-acyl-sn-glycerol-3-phosphate acyltransferase [Oscillospiraceae bacterium]